MNELKKTLDENQDKWLKMNQLKITTKMRNEKKKYEKDLSDSFSGGHILLPLFKR
jgi:hypothetical protein